MPTTVYLADLRYNYGGLVNIDAMPIGIGYMKAVMDRDLPEVRSRLFAYPDRLWDALASEPPDVLMLSNYVWNERLACHFARLMKRIRPDTLVVMGGPNVPIEDARTLEFVRCEPAIDVYVLGEGDFLATEVVRLYLEAGCSIPALRTIEIPSAILRREGDDLVMQPIWKRRKDVDDIVSPYLTGVLDEFFDGKLAPMIETNRGCPFACTFCVQGTGWYTKVNYFSRERVLAELDGIAERVRRWSPSMGTLVIADPNYGMFERDAEISRHIGELQARYGWPTFISASTGKNRPDRIIKAIEPLNRALPFRQALQSTNEETLVQIKRANIRQEVYSEVMTHVQGRGMRSMSDLILGLPGETLQSHLDGIRGLVDARTNELLNFQAMLLKGTELETLESRRRHRFVTRFRVLPKEFGVYGGEKVFDMDEIVVSTDTLSFDDYLTARTYGFGFSVFWNNAWFEEAVGYAERSGVKRSVVFEAMLDRLRRDTGPARALLDGFLAETRNELFPTREACIEHYAQEENFQRLVDGEIGDNLIYKYRCLASFFVWPEICRVAMEAVRDLLVRRGIQAGIPGFDEFWDDFHRYVELTHAHGHSADELLAPVTVSLRYDVSAWLRAGGPEDTRPFRLAAPRAFRFSLPITSAEELRRALAVWTLSVKGLTKGVTRIRPGAQVRDCVPADA